MKTEVQHQLMRKAFAHLDAGTTDLADSIYRNPVANYTNSDVLAAEIKHLFRELPLLMGFSCLLPTPGSYITDERSGVPILMARGMDGQVRAFLNVCRHRGSRVAEGAGCKRVFICPYHSWTYDLEGKLKGIPDGRNFPDVAREEHGLVPLPAAEHNGMLWVRAKPAANGSTALDIATYLGALYSEFASYEYSNYHHYKTAVIEQKMNWKLGVDTFLEGYHISELHKKSVAKYFTHNLAMAETFGPHIRVALPRRSIETQRELNPSEWSFVHHNTIVYVVFPNTVLVMQLDRAEIWRFFPLDGKVNECVMYLDFFVPRPMDNEADTAKMEKSMQITMNTVLKEDFATCETMQKNFASDAQSHTTFGRNEPGLTHFHKTVKAYLSNVDGA